MKTICSADFPDSLGLCRNSLSFFWSRVPFLGEHVPHGGALMSCLMPFLGPGLPEDRNPGPKPLQDSLRPGGAHCSPARRLKAVAPPSGLQGHLALISGTVCAFTPRKPPALLLQRQALGGPGVRGCGSGLYRSNGRGARTYDTCSLEEKL